MPLVERDTDPDRVDELLETVEKDVSVSREILREEDARVLAIATILSALGVWFATEIVSEAGLALSITTGIAAVVFVVSVYVGLDSVDRLACLGWSSHECRYCRKESERWEETG